MKEKDNDESLEDIAEKDAHLAAAEARDLVTFGLIPEFVGRFPVIVPFHSLDVDTLLRIMTEPKNSLLAQQKASFNLDKVFPVIR